MTPFFLSALSGASFVRKKKEGRRWNPWMAQSHGTHSFQGRHTGDKEAIGIDSKDVLVLLFWAACTEIRGIRYCICI